jgi:hypothetical protein
MMMLYHRFDAVYGILVPYQLAHLPDLIGRYRGELLKELPHTDSHAHEVTKSFNTNTGSAEHGLSVLDFGVNGNSVKSIHPDCGLTGVTGRDYTNSWIILPRHKRLVETGK